MIINLVFDFHVNIFLCLLGVEGAGLLLWVGDPPGASFGFYLREAFPSQTHAKKILYNESHLVLIGTDEQQLHKISHYH